MAIVNNFISNQSKAPVLWVRIKDFEKKTNSSIVVDARLWAFFILFYTIILWGCLLEWKFVSIYPP